MRIKNGFMKGCLFENLKMDDIKNKTILLDIDGTIVEDGGEVLSEKVIGKIEELKKNNKVYFCSNKNTYERNKRLADSAKAFFLDAPCKKPNKKILNFIENNGNLSILVIGDKFLTDGLFAKNIGARFIKVQRMFSVNDRWVIKFICFIDDAAGFFFGFLFNN